MFQLAPINLSPTNSYIDANDPNRFSWQCIGATPTHATVTFYDINNTFLFTKTYTVTSINIDNIYSFPIYSATLTNGNSYLWDVTSYTGTSGKTSERFLVYTHRKPTIDWATPIPTLVTNIFIDFDTIYSTYDNIILSKYKFDLYLWKNGLPELVKTTGWIFDQNVAWSYNGLLDNSTYLIICTIEDSVYSRNSVTYMFGVDYNEIISADLTIVPNDEDGYINITLTGVGRNYGNYYKNNIINATPLFTTGKFGDSVYLENNSYVVFKDSNLTDYTFNLWFNLDSGFIGDIVTLEDGQTFGFDGTYYYYKTTAGYSTISPQITNPYGDWTFIQMIYGNILIKNSTQQTYIGGTVWNISYLDSDAWLLAWWSLTTMNGEIYRNPEQYYANQIGLTTLM